MAKKDSIVREVAQRARIRLVCGHHYVPVVNCTAFEQEVCAEMLQRFPEASFVACWHERADGCQLWTLRSRKQDGSEGKTCDVSRVAWYMYGNGDACHAEFIDPAIDAERLIEERDTLLKELSKRS